MPKHASAKSRLLFVDLLNVIACLAVVYLHVSLTVYSPANDPHWLRDVGLQAACIFAVPVFFMISGMNLLGYRDKYDTPTFFRKRVRRVGVALLAGSVICYLAYGLFPDLFWGAEQVRSTFGPVDFVKRVLTNQVNDVYWFFYTIICLYVMTPVLSLATHDKKVLEYILACCLVTGVGIPLAEFAGVSGDYLNPLLGWPMFANSALLYYVGGYYLKNYFKVEKGSLWSRPPTWAAVAIVAAAAMLLAGLAANGYLSGAPLPETYLSYPISTPCPLCIAEAVAVFMFARTLEPRLQALPKGALCVLSRLSAASIDIYLVHMLVINWLGVHYGLPGMNALRDNAYLRGLFVYGVTCVAVVAWQTLKGAAKGRRKA